MSEQSLAGIDPESERPPDLVDRRAVIELSRVWPLFLVFCLLLAAGLMSGMLHSLLIMVLLVDLIATALAAERVRRYVNPVPPAVVTAAVPTRRAIERRRGTHAEGRRDPWDMTFGSATANRALRDPYQNTSITWLPAPARRARTTAVARHAGSVNVFCTASGARFGVPTDAVLRSRRLWSNGHARSTKMPERVFQLCQVPRRFSTPVQLML